VLHRLGGELLERLLPPHELRSGLVRPVMRELLTACVLRAFMVHFTPAAVGRVRGVGAWQGGRAVSGG
jgi:hypothetical protein